MGTQNKTGLRKYYTILLELGLIASLLIFIIAMNANLPGKQNTVDFSNEEEIVTIQRIPQTSIDNQPPPPAEPTVNPKVPIDEPIVDEPNIDIDFETPNENIPEEVPAKTDPQPTEEIFMAVEQEPEIVGGQKELYEKLQYPARCRRAGIQGRVILSFVVNTDGSLQDIEVTRGIGGGCDEAAIEALKEVTFKPGRQRGNPVRVRFSWPILFQLK